jgi:hypothetical protein
LCFRHSDAIGVLVRPGVDNRRDAPDHGRP